MSASKRPPTKGMKMDIEEMIEMLEDEGFTIVTTQDTIYAISVNLPTFAKAKSVDVYAPRLTYGETVPATINWGGIGSVTAEDTAAYASLLKAAARFAAALNALHEI